MQVQTIYHNRGGSVEGAMSLTQAGAGPEIAFLGPRGGGNYFIILEKFTSISNRHV